MRFSHAFSTSHITFSPLSLSLLSIPLLSLSPCHIAFAYPSLPLLSLLPFSLPILSGMFFWPSLADVNTRARRLVSAWVKNQKREEQKQLHLMKVKVPHVPVQIHVYVNQNMFVT